MRNERNGKFPAFSNQIPWKCKQNNEAKKSHTHTLKHSTQSNRGRNCIHFIKRTTNKEIKKSNGTCLSEEPIQRIKVAQAMNDDDYCLQITLHRFSSPRKMKRWRSIFVFWQRESHKLNQCTDLSISNMLSVIFVFGFNELSGDTWALGVF